MLPLPLPTLPRSTRTDTPHMYDTCEYGTELVVGEYLPVIATITYKALSTSSTFLVAVLMG